MTASQKSSSPLVEIVRAARTEEPVLANLLELYAHDFSEFMDLKLDASGRFGYEPLPLYWQEPGRHPFLIKVDGQLAGFIFVNKGSRVSGDENVWDVAEFFIVRGYRRLGIGRKAAQEVWKKFPGSWEVRVMCRNEKALLFWERAVKEFTGEMVQPAAFEKNGERWNMFSFESKP